MLLVRAAETGSNGYRFLVWNLFLAWVPFLLALALYDANRRGASGAWQLGLAVAWLLFLPNAPYIVTDFLHVGVIGGAPIWFDAALVAAFAATGVMLGLGSLLLVQTIVSRACGELWGWLMLAPLLGLCSVGIALGRVYRFNSWDALPARRRPPRRGRRIGRPGVRCSRDRAARRLDVLARGRLPRALRGLGPRALA